MEQKIKTPNCKKDDDATMEKMENTESVVNTLSSSKTSEDWEKISEDWVPLFLDPTILDDHFRSLPLDFENYLQFDSILPEINNHFSLQDLLADSLLLHSTNDQLSHNDMALGSSLHVIENLFRREDSSLQANITHPKNDHLKHNNSTLPTSILTQVSNSSSEMEVDLWKNKDADYDLSMMLKQKTNAKALSNFECLTSPSTLVPDLESGYSNNLVENTLQSSCLLQYEEDEIGSCNVEFESTSSSDSIVQVGIPPSASQSKTFGTRHLQSIGNSINFGLLRRSKDKGINTQSKKNCEVQSFKLQNQEVLKEQQSSKKDGHKERIGGDKGTEKQQAWLMCNCKSAQLSKKKRKVYVNELEDKLQIMAANVVDLNTTISHLTAENVKLQRKLGYYCLPPSACLRPKVPMHVMSIGPLSTPMAKRPMYSSGQMPPIPISIPQTKTHIPIYNSKRPKFGATKDRGDKKQIKLKAIGVVSIVTIGFIYIVMLFGSINQGYNGSNVMATNQVENVQVEGDLLTNWNKHLNHLNSTEVNPQEFRYDWLPLEPGQYGPEREGILSIHTQLAPKKLHFETIKSKEIIKVGLESFVKHSIDGNATLKTSTSPNYFKSKNTLLLIDSKAIPINTSQSFEAFVFVLNTNGLVKVDRKPILQSVMIGNKATKKNSNKKYKSGSKKKEEAKQFIQASSKLQAMKNLSTKTLDNLMSKESKVLKNATIRSFIIDKFLLQNLNSTIEANNLLLLMLGGGSLQQLLFGALYGPKTKFVSRKLTKKVKFQVFIDNYKVIPTTQETFYSFIPYDAALKEPIMCKRNISDNVKEAMHMPIINEERFESLMPFWIAMQPLAYNQLLQKKAHKGDTCSVPTLSKLFWAANTTSPKALEPQQCLLTDCPVLNTAMCTKLLQFDKVANTSSKKVPNSKAKSMVELAIKVTQGNPHNATSTISLHVVPCSEQDPIVVPFLCIRSKSSLRKEAKGHNRTDPRVDKTVQEQIHNQNMRHGMLSMVVLVMADSEEYVDNRKKGTKRLSRIFVVVLTNKHKYMTYSCMLPYGDPQAHVVVE